MRKIFLAAAVIFSLMFAQAQAAEYHETNESYAVTENDGGKITDVYILGAPQKTNYGFKVFLHSIGRNHRMDKHWVLGFKMVGDDLYAVLHHGFIDDATAQVTRGDTIVSEYYWAIFVAAMEKQ